MKVTYKHETGEFNFVTGDRVEIVVISKKYARKGKSPVSYHGEIMEIDQDGFWAVLDDDPTRKKFFAFVEVEEVKNENSLN